MRIEALALLGLCACQGSIGDTFPTPVDVVGRPGSDEADAPSASAPPEEVLRCAPRVESRLALLSDLQHLTSLRALLGDDALVGEELPQVQLKPFLQKGTVVNTSLVHTRREWARIASETKPPRLDCDPGEAACVEGFLRTFAARAFRRPIEDEEIADLMEVYALAAQESPAHGVQRAVEAVLAAPSVAYRRELGQETAAAVRTLSAYELASVLSFALTDGPPDDALWKSASDGTLLQASEQRAQVKRMLADPKVQQALTGTLLAAWGLGNIFGASKDPTSFPTFTPQLMASMYHETELMVSDVLWTRAAPIHELLSTTRTFVDAPLAQLYGVSPPKAAFDAVTLPDSERAGLLTQASVLAMLARSDNTSVVARGLFVRGLFCMSKVPSPPESLTTAISDLLKQDLTERERADVRAKNPTCGGCHAGIDPYGLLLEQYDALGRFRMTADDAPITVLDAFAGDYTDTISFLRAAAESEEFSSCVGTRVLSYALQDDALAPSDCQVTDALAGADPAALTMPELVERMLTAPSVAYRKEMP